MAFRADEAARLGYEDVESYFIPRARDMDEAQRTRSRVALQDLADTLGPVVDAYPSWHPLVSHHEGHFPVVYPSAQCGYQGLDHTRMFANGFITCPYGDGQEVIDSVQSLPYNPAATITAERLDFQLYNPDVTPIVVKCIWKNGLERDGTIPLATAAALLLAKEIPCWESAQVAETWESMRPYFMGRPHGSRSSLFVNQETGQALKKVWNTIIFTGMFGPIKV
ncbi:hypothetical protein [Massilia sp. YIM B04103]|uniref:hypothetical protein n=1 Tax=Massilia sp. YIM B04103 TaxID=2963106 RepID=UPI00210E8833|nr:hypothetical protein [Massilia sp. YIM B04103]